MNEKECIDRGMWYCPKCGEKGSIKLEEEI
jgi:hypothetical protein